MAALYELIGFLSLGGVQLHEASFELSVLLNAISVGASYDWESRR